MVSTLRAPPVPPMQHLHSGSSLPHTAPEDVRVSLVELPLDHDIGGLVEVRTGIDLFSPEHAFHHWLPGIGIAPRGELSHKAVAHLLIRPRCHAAQWFPTLEVDPDRWEVWRFLRIGLGQRPIDGRESRP